LSFTNFEYSFSVEVWALASGEKPYLEEQVYSAANKVKWIITEPPMFNIILPYKKSKTQTSNTLVSSMDQHF
jgi:hypothetical protein